MGWNVESLLTMWSVDADWARVLVPIRARVSTRHVCGVTFGEAQTATEFIQNPPVMIGLARSTSKDRSDGWQCKQGDSGWEPRQGSGGAKHPGWQQDRQ